jgi:hypothetical protein
MEDYYFNPLEGDEDFTPTLTNPSPPPFTTTILRRKVIIDYEAIARREIGIRQTQPVNKFSGCLN